MDSRRASALLRFRPQWELGHFPPALAGAKCRGLRVGPGEQTGPRLSSDASWVFYWGYATQGPGASASMRLLRVPVSLGAPESVLEASRGAAVRCAPRHLPCVISELDKVNSELVFTAFDPLRGRSGELVRLATDPEESPAWDLSPDGSTIAVVDLD